MLEGFKRWLSTSPASGVAGWEGIAGWAGSANYAFRGQGEEGFTIEGRLGQSPWRMEWGPSQRPYFEGGELRLRAEPGTDPELQALLISRELQDQLEKRIFEQYVEDVQTRMDTQTPPEMRWLVMLPKLAGSDLGPLREHYGVLGNAKPWLQAWLHGGLTAALQSRVAAEAGPAAPMVLMLGRGRLTQRCALAQPTVPELQRQLALFEVALRESRRAYEDLLRNAESAAQQPPRGGESVPPAGEP